MEGKGGGAIVEEGGYEGEGREEEGQQHGPTSLGFDP